MSKIALSGPASGTATYTISAPTGATDRTITLPDQTGTLLTGSGAIGVNSSAATNSLVIDASGNVGVGTSSPGAKFQVAGTQTISNGSSAGSANGLHLWFNTSTNTAYIQGFQSGVDWRPIVYNATQHIWQTTDVERMRIDSSGNLLVGTTSASSVAAGSVNIKSGIAFSGGTTGTYYYTIQSNSTDFYIGTQTLSRYAALVGLNTFTAWSFGSDRRIKTEIEDIKYGLDSVLAMQPRQYKFKDGGDFSVGFIAQELKEVLPEAVSGEEIEFNDADTPQERAKKTMGVSKDLLIPVLVKAIQEQQAIITALTARVTALEGTQP